MAEQAKRKWTRHFKRSDSADHTLGRFGIALTDIGKIVLIILGVIVAIATWEAVNAWKGFNKTQNNLDAALLAENTGTIPRLNKVIDKLDKGSDKVLGENGSVDRTNELISATTKTMNDAGRTVDKAGRETSSLISSVRTDTLPRVNQNLDAFKDIQRELRDKTIPGVNDMMAKLGLTIADLDEHVIKEAGLTIEQFRTLMKDPRIGQVLDGLIATNGDLQKALQGVALLATNSAASMAHIEEGLRKFPELMDTWNKMVMTAKKWQKALLFARFLGLLGPLVGAVFPY